MLSGLTTSQEQCPRSCQHFSKLEVSRYHLSGMSSGGFEWSQWNTAKQTAGDKAFGSISRHLTFPFPFFMPITLSEVQVTIPHYSGQFSHCSLTLPCPNWASAAQNCFSPRLVEVMGYRGTLIWGIESLIWSHDLPTSLLIWVLETCYITSCYESQIK